VGEQVPDEHRLGRRDRDRRRGHTAPGMADVDPASLTPGESDERTVIIGSHIEL
jgi:hypothetical protein